MRILYSSVFRDGTGYSKAACNFVRRLQLEGHTVQCHIQKLSQRDEEPPPYISTKDVGPYDVCIQHTLPNFWEYKRGLGRNIGLFAYDNTNGLPQDWGSYIDLMDEVWVIGSQESVDAILRAHPTKTPLKHIAQPAALSDYEGEFNVMGFRNKIGDDFAFYCVGEFNRRKNWVGLLKCFYSEFTPDENVQLVCKTDDVNGLAKVAAEVRDVVGMSGHRPEIIVRERLTDKQMLDLHYSCDCYVNCSLGEAWNMPLFDAVAMGKPGISNFNYGPSLYVADGLILSPDETTEQSCVGQHPFSIRETWSLPSEFGIRQRMRKVFEDRAFRVDCVANGLYKTNKILTKFNLTRFLLTSA